MNGPRRVGLEVSNHKPKFYQNLERAQRIGLTIRQGLTLAHQTLSYPLKSAKRGPNDTPY